MDFSISTTEHLVRVGQRDHQQGGTVGAGQDQAGLESAMSSLPVVILFLRVASMQLSMAVLKDTQSSWHLEMRVIKSFRENVAKSTKQVRGEFSDPPELLQKNARQQTQTEVQTPILDRCVTLGTALPFPGSSLFHLQ